MKKLAAVFLAGIMCVSLAACGSSAADDAASTDTQTAAEKLQKRQRMTLPQQIQKARRLKPAR